MFTLDLIIFGAACMVLLAIVYCNFYEFFYMKEKSFLESAKLEGWVLCMLTCFCCGFCSYWFDKTDSMYCQAVQTKMSKDSANTEYYGSIEKTDLLIEAIAQHESGDDSTATSSSSTASGHLQELKVVVDDANKIVGYNKWTYSDRFSKKDAEEMFLLIQRKYNPQLDIERAIRLWNGGPHYTNKETDVYYEAVRKIYNKKVDDRLTDIAKNFKALNLK